MKWFDGPRYRIAYRELGDGPPLYVIQGICSRQSLLAPLAVQLSSCFRTVVYDLVGIQDDDHSDLSRYRLEDFPEDLIGLADHLEDHQFDVLGNSFGVSVALRAMRAHPDRIARGTLVSGFARRPLTGRERLALRLLWSIPGRQKHVPFLKSILRYNHGLELDRREPELVEFLIRESGTIRIRTAARQALFVDQTDVRELASAIRQPTLVIHGNDDRLVSAALAADLAQRLTNVRIMLVPGCGHLPHLSHPELLAHSARRFHAEESRS